MKKRRKRHIIFLFALMWLLTLTACGQTGAAADFPTEESSGVYMETISAAEQGGVAPARAAFDCKNIADIICRIQECNLDIGKGIIVFGPDDFAPQEIACDNIFSTYRDGRENQEIQALYDAAGEQWEYLWYVEYDFDGDGEQDYIVLHDCPDKKAGVDIGGGDVWIAGENWRRIELPETIYLIDGTWEKPQLYMMLLTPIYGGRALPSFAVYQDYIRLEMALYASRGWYDGYKRVRAVTIEEEVAGARSVQTGFSTPDDGDSEPVRLQITWDRDEQHGNQVIMLDRVRSPLAADMHNCKAWDGNDDSYEDILYYTGYDGGSGGDWDYYYLLCWSEEEQEYESMELPGCDYISYEDHKLHSLVHDGSGGEYYAIYGLRDGEYQLEKSLDTWYCNRKIDEMTEGWVLEVRYSEDGEVVETTDLFPAPDWEEAKSILKEKYPEFTCWY